MFDIKEYYYNYQYRGAGIGEEISEFDEDVTSAIDSLTGNRLDSIYLRDRYKYQQGMVEIIHPSLVYPKSSSLLLTADKIRYLLSFYPHKTGLVNIEKIVVRPKYTAVGDVELISLYLRRKRVLVLYLFHPHFYRISDSSFNSFNETGSFDLAHMRSASISDKRLPVTGSQSELYIHPLWYIISLVEHDDTDRVDKFLIKRSQVYMNLSETLNDISYFYSQHGY
ncbi:MAG: hypothetical protein JXA20_02055 [Spirochaetes bacterium]|nr:hypothetical protein [Spirochaetota bacterium]